MRTLQWTIYLAAAVGGDPVGGGMVGEGVDGEIHIVLGGRLETVVCVCLDLLMTGSGWSLHGERLRAFRALLEGCC